jgi:hypothetical protein
MGLMCQGIPRAPGVLLNLDSITQNYTASKKSLLQKSLFVIPAEAGNQIFQGFLDPGLRLGDGFIEF